MKKDLIEFLYGVSQEESELESLLTEDFAKMLEEADAEEAKSMKAEKSPLVAALKSLGINGSGLVEDPEGFVMTTDDRAEYAAAVDRLFDPEHMHALAKKGWVPFKCGDQAMANEKPEFKLRFLEIAAHVASDSDTGEEESAIVKNAREFATEEPEHDEDSPVDHDAPKGNDLDKVKVGKPTDGEKPKGKIKDSMSVSASDIMRHLLDEDGTAKTAKNK